MCSCEHFDVCEVFWHFPLADWSRLRIIAHFIEHHRAWGVSCRATAQLAAKRGEAGPGCRSGCARLAPQDGGHLHVAPITTTGGLDAAGGALSGHYRFPISRRPVCTTPLITNCPKAWA